MEITYNSKQLEIMQKALELFALKGYDNSSVRDLAKAAGVNVAMISYYFGSKERLLEAIFTNYSLTMHDKLERIVKARDEDPVTKLEQIVDTYVEMILENRNFHLLMLREQLVFKNSSLSQLMREMKERNSLLVRTAVKAGEKAGSFRKNVDIPMLAQTLFGTVNQTVSNRNYICEKYNVDPEDDKAFERIVVPKLKAHLKSLFKYFLINENTEKK